MIVEFIKKSLLGRCSLINPKKVEKVEIVLFDFGLLYTVYSSSSWSYRYSLNPKKIMVVVTSFSDTPMRTWYSHLTPS